MRVQPNPNERAIAVFDAFLRYAREGRAPTLVPARMSAPPPAKVSPPSSGPSTIESPAAHDHEDAPDEQTDPNMRTADTAPAREVDEFEEIPTRQSRLPEAMAASTAPNSDAMWDEPTRERPDVVREMRSQPPPPDPVSFHRIPVAVAPENSIIIDDDMSTTEPVASDDLRAVRTDATRIDTFVTEMTVLIKYGHAGDVPREIERWLRGNPDDLNSQVRIAEFERTRIDASVGLDRLFWIASRALDRGDREVAARVLEIVTREAYGDLRRSALQDRVGAR